MRGETCGGTWAGLQELFAEALEAPPEERPAILARAGSPGQRGELEELLAAAEKAGGFLEEPAPLPLSLLSPEAAGPPPSPDRNLHQDLAGSRLGPYRLERQIGRGGMSVVYEARRIDGAYEQRVAVKLLKRGLDGHRWRRRFAAERQILARLQHPAIARLLDGGSTADGLPYAVMELVEGEPIDAYCQSRGLGLPQRLALFLRICTAVAFAHRNLVVHRDLKPANVLVTAEGEPRLLDFGIAKLLEGGEAGPETVTGLRILTPGWAAPEQLRGEPVSTATDVYALGVLLYRLLAGSLPWRVEGLEAGALARVQEEEPDPPSLRCRAEGADLPPTPREAWSRRLKGDLDAIVAKALRPDPEHRYASVESLVRDLDRHRRGLPVQARKGGTAYRLKKFLRRHRTAVAVASLLAASLVAITVTTLAQNGRVAQERDAARAERQEKEEALAFLVDLFQEADPREARDASVSVADLLDRAAENVARADALPAGSRIPLYRTLAQVNHQAGRYEQALEQRRREIALRRREGEQGEELIRSLNALGHTLVLADAPDRAARAYREAEARERAFLPADHPLRGDTLVGLGAVTLRQGRAEEASRLLEEAIGILRPHEDRGNQRRLADALVDRAQAERSAGRLGTAEAHLREAAAVERRLATSIGREEKPSPSLAIVLRELSAVLVQTERFEEAEATGQEALATFRATLPPDHPEIVYSLAQLASLARDRGRLEEAEALFRHTLAFNAPPFGPGSLHRASLLNNLGTVLRQQEDFPAAEAVTREALEIYRRHYGYDPGQGTGGHPNLVAALSNLGLCRHRQGDADEARRLYVEALEMAERLLGPDHPALAYTLLRWGELEVDEARLTEAEPLLRRALEIRRARLPAGHGLILEAEAALAELSS